MFSTDQDLIEHGEEFIQHFGVKGMKWGVRKNESSSAKDRRLKNKEIVLQKTLKGGGEVIVTKTPPLKVLQKLGGVIPKLGQYLDDYANFSIRDKNGKPVGDVLLSDGRSPKSGLDRYRQQAPRPGLCDSSFWSSCAVC